MSVPPKAETAKRGRGRPRKGEVTQYKGGRKGGRVTRDIDGVSVRKRVRLETLDEAVARKKLERLGKNPAAPITIAHSDETFAEAAERISAKRGAAKKLLADSMSARAAGLPLEDLDKLKNHAFPLIGALPVTAVTTKHVQRILKAMQAAGLELQTAKHVRNAMNAVFKDIVLDDELPYELAGNPVLVATMPDFGKRLKKERASLEDDELLVYMRWRHPVGTIPKSPSCNGKSCSRSGAALAASARATCMPTDGSISRSATALF